MTNKQKWAHGLAAAFIGGLATALDSGLALLIVAPADFNLDKGLVKTLEIITILGILGGAKLAFAYLKTAPLPEDITNVPKQ